MCHEYKREEGEEIEIMNMSLFMMIARMCQQMDGHDDRMDKNGEAEIR